MVYADFGPIAVAHSRDLLEEHGGARRPAAIHADLRAPDRLWTQAKNTGVVDLNKPTAISPVNRPRSFSLKWGR